jgi:hypothetical protein
MFTGYNAKTSREPKNGPDPIGSGRKRAPYDFDPEKTRNAAKHGEIELRIIFVTYIIREESRNQRGGQARARWSRLAPFSRSTSQHLASRPGRFVFTLTISRHREHARAPAKSAHAHRATRWKRCAWYVRRPSPRARWLTRMRLQRANEQDDAMRVNTHVCAWVGARG